MVAHSMLLASHKLGGRLGQALLSVNAVNYLVVAGGGGGAYYIGGGGGAGGMISGTNYLVSPGVTYTVTVGGAGAGGVSGGTGNGTSGSNSVFNAISTTGGGGGGHGEGGGSTGLAGGSGGGQGRTGNGRGGSIGLGTGYQGNKGGQGSGSGGGDGLGSGGGGGGANQYGQYASSSTGGAGGAGANSSITGSLVTYAGGGGGGAYNGTGGAGGIGGGGAGGGSGTGTAGSTNLGSGGGSGGYCCGGGGAGGSGIVIISYANTFANSTFTGSPTCSDVSGNLVFKFTGSGTITFGGTSSISATATATPTWVTASGSIGSDYTQRVCVFTVSASGGGITYSVISGSLPTGLTLDATTGYISGIATGVSDYSSSTYSFTLRASNSFGTADRAFTIKITSRYLGYRCSTTGENGSCSDTAPGSNVFNRVDFSAYGTPGGSCGSFTLGGCNSQASNYYNPTPCASYSISMSNSQWGDPCGGTGKAGYVQMSYGPF